jgi:hypothetical protein
MPADDQRDRLDGWLDQEVRPLPPPPGTFELITRRARRRKLRKLAVSVASAAAVVAVAVVVTPPLMSLRVTPTQVAGPAANGQSTASSSDSPQPNGSASRFTSPAPSNSPTAATPPLGPVPPNFQPVSVTFVSTATGWVIGQAGTPGKCANKTDPYICTSIARTDDAGKTWHGGPAPATTAPLGDRGVSGIRFLNGTNGWAFGPELWATHDAGRTWTQVNTNGNRVTDLETSGGRAFALWATCSGVAGSWFAADCTSYTLMTTTAGSDNWTAVGGATNGLTAGGAATSGVIALFGTTGYLLAPDGTLYSGPLDGPWQRVGTAQCQPGQTFSSGLPSRALLALVSATTVVTACNAPGGVRVYTSADSGATWNAQAAAAWSATADPASATSLAAAPDGTLTLATRNGVYVLPAGTPEWKQAQVDNAPVGGFRYVGMTSNRQGVALPFDTTLHEVWMTFDGGLTWKAQTPITPGN